MNLALIEDSVFVLRFCVLLLVLGVLGMFAVRRWPRLLWPGAVGVILLAVSKARHFIPRAAWPEEARVAVWLDFATIVVAGALAVGVMVVGGRRRAARSAA